MENKSPEKSWDYLLKIFEIILLTITAGLLFWQINKLSEQIRLDARPILSPNTDLKDRNSVVNLGNGPAFNILRFTVRVTSSSTELFMAKDRLNVLGVGKSFSFEDVGLLFSPLSKENFNTFMNNNFPIDSRTTSEVHITRYNDVLGNCYATVQVMGGSFYDGYKDLGKCVK